MEDLCAKMPLEVSQTDLQNEPEVLAAAISCMSDAVLLTDLQGRPLRANAACEELLGELTPDLLPTAWPETFSLSTVGRERPIRPDEIPVVHALRGEHECVLHAFSDGEGFDGGYVAITANPMHDTDGNIIGSVVVIRDTTETRWAEEELRSTNERLVRTVQELEQRADAAELVTAMGDLLQSCREIDEFNEVIRRYLRWIFDGQRGGIYLKSAGSSTFDAVMEWGKSSSMSSFAPTDCWALRRARSHTVTPSGLAPPCHHVGEVDIEYTCVPMMGDGEGIGILHLQNLPEDTSLGRKGAEALMRARERTMASVADHIALSLANLRLREKLQKQAVRDPLTGLFNRRHMEDALHRELARAQRAEASVAAILIDIDHFKHFNDEYGHAAADEVLREFGGLLRNLFRDEDVCCRYGGEEMVVILPDANLDGAVAAANRLAEKIRRLRISYDGRELGTITASMGVAMWPEHAPTSAALIRAADAAMYEAKRAGRDRVRVFDDSKKAAEEDAE